MELKQITLTHLNIRQSIVILLAKLVTTDLLLAIVIIAFYFTLVLGEQFSAGASSNTSLFLLSFAAVGFIKIVLSVYIVLQWINEYYEITPEAVIHKRGIINKRAERYTLERIRRINVQDTFIGELCNFATLTLYDLRLNKSLDMYLIHNADRYARVLKTLKPELETKTDRKFIPFLPKRDDLAGVQD